MNRRAQLAVAIVVVFALLCVPVLEVLTVRPAPTAAAQSAPPSILVIQTDDMRFDDLLAMPNTKAFIQNQGMIFDNYIAGGTPLCCPNRSTALTGRYPHNHGVLTNGGANGGHGAFKRRGNEGRTIAVALKAVGYTTAFIGKYMNHYPSGKRGQVPPGWDSWHALIMDLGCDECRGGQETGYYYNYRLNQNGKVRAYGDNKGDYSTNVFTREALKIIAATPATSPLFLWVNPMAPHGPWTPGPGDKKAKVPGQSRTAAFNTAGAGKVKWIKKLPKMKSNLRAFVRKANTERRRTLLAVDDMVATLVPAMAPGSWVFFLSDNGYMLGEYKIPIGKVVPYKPSVEVPLIVSGPGVARGSYSAEIVSSIDLAPTWAAIAGITTLPWPVDGLNILPILTNDGTMTPRDSVLLEWGGSTVASAVDDLDGDVLPNSLFTSEASPTSDTVEAERKKKNKKKKKGKKGKKKKGGKGKKGKKGKNGKGKKNKRPDRNPETPNKNLYKPLPYYALRGPTWLYIEWRDGHKEYYDHGTQPDELNNEYAGLSQARKDELGARVLVLKNCSGESCTIP